TRRSGRRAGGGSSVRRESVSDRRAVPPRPRRRRTHRRILRGHRRADQAAHARHRALARPALRAAGAVTIPLGMPDDPTNAAHTPNEAYHRCAFPDRAQAAAFVAALSRFVRGPRGAPYRDATRGAVVWSRTRDDSEAVDLYLSEAALRATIEAFGEPNVLETVGRAALPAACALLFTSTSPAWGMEQADAQLRGDAHE